MNVYQLRWNFIYCLSRRWWMIALLKSRLTVFIKFTKTQTVVKLISVVPLLFNDILIAYQRGFQRMDWVITSSLFTLSSIENHNINLCWKFQLILTFRFHVTSICVYFISHKLNVLNFLNPDLKKIRFFFLKHENTV